MRLLHSNWLLWLVVREKIVNGLFYKGDDGSCVYVCYILLTLQPGILGYAKN